MCLFRLILPSWVTNALCWSGESWRLLCTVHYGCLWWRASVSSSVTVSRLRSGRGVDGRKRRLSYLYGVPWPSSCLKEMLSCFQGSGATRKQETAPDHFLIWPNELQSCLFFHIPGKQRDNANQMEVHCLWRSCDESWIVLLFPSFTHISNHLWLCLLCYSWSYCERLMLELHD